MSAFTRRSLLGGSLLAYAWAVAPFARAQSSAGAAAGSGSAAAPANTNWTSYAGTTMSHRYVPLDQITAANFNDLEVAWRFRPDAMGPRPEFNLQSTPVVVNGRLYSTCGTRRDVVALDAATSRRVPQVE